MHKLRQAILGEGNRANTIMGACMVVGVICYFIATGDLDTEKLALGASLIAGGIGLGLSRGGGTGSDTPPVG